MKSFEERKEAILSRSAAKIAKRKKTRRWVTATCVPLVLCVCVMTGYLALMGFGKSDNAAPEAAGSDYNYGMAADAESPEMAPESAPGKKPVVDAPERPDHYEEVIELTLGRDYRYFGYNQKYIVDAFLEILEGESYGPVEEDRIRAEKYFSSFDPAKDELLEDDEYIVTLHYPGNMNVDFILRGDQLTRADGVSYHLTQEQATLLHNMAEGNWEWNAPVLSEEQIIDVVKNEVTWNYYAVTAEQDPQSGDWTVTFWSRDRESYQMFTVSQKGKILQRWAGFPADE